MASIEYRHIAANIGTVHTDGAHITVAWKCAASGAAVGESSATMRPDASVTGRMKSSVKRDILREVTWGIMRAIGGVLGGTAGRIAYNAASSAAYDLESKAAARLEFSDADREAAIVQAFNAVYDRFTWDGFRFVKKA